MVFAARNSAAPVRADASAEAVRRIGAFNHGGELRVADARHAARGADRAWSDADLDDVRAREDELFGHVARDDVACHDDEVGVRFADFLDEVDEGFGVAVRDVDADVLDGASGKGAHDGLKLLPVPRSDAERIKGRGLSLKVREVLDVGLFLVVLVERRRELMALERAGHFEGARRVHVGRNDGNAPVDLGAVQELEFAGDVDLAAACERRALRSDEHVLEVKAGSVFEMHGAFPPSKRFRFGSCPWGIRQGPPGGRTQKTPGSRGTQRLLIVADAPLDFLSDIQSFEKRGAKDSGVGARFAREKFVGKEIRFGLAAPKGRHAIPGNEHLPG